MTLTFIKEITDKAKMLAHYNACIDENNDPVHDPASLKAHMDKWDDEAFIEALQLSLEKSVGERKSVVLWQCGTALWRLSYL